MHRACMDFSIPSLSRDSILIPGGKAFGMDSGSIERNKKSCPVATMARGVIESSPLASRNRIEFQRPGEAHITTRQVTRLDQNSVLRKITTVKRPPQSHRCPPFPQILRLHLCRWRRRRQEPEEKEKKNGEKRNGQHVKSQIDRCRLPSPLWRMKINTV